MERREFIVTLGAAVALAAPLAAEAQQATSAQAKHVGWLALVPQPRLLSEFRRGLRGLGYVEGSYTLHERYAQGMADRLPALAADLTRVNIDVIVGEAAAATEAAQRATKTIPIVFITGDPVGQGFVQSLARPGGNLTGIGNLSVELYPKRVEMLKEAVPTLRRLAVVEAATVSRPALISKTVREAARAQGIEALPVTFVSRTEEVDEAFAHASRAGADAILVAPHPFFNVHRDRLLALATRYRLPALYEFRDFVEAGGFMCYGADMKEVYRRLAIYVDRILKGAKPADLPVEQPTKYELIINVKTAKALGLTIPSSLLLRADQVIE
jgi:putative tryptophan/tyrosine transport system substrate-binding protein